LLLNQKEVPMNPLTSLVTVLAAGAAAALQSTVEPKMFLFHRKRLRLAIWWHHGKDDEPSPDALLKWTLTPRVLHA
jgi:hypothetical protein